MAHNILPKIGTGVTSLQLAAALDVFPKVPAITGAAAPAFDGTFPEFLTRHEGAAHDALAVQLRNKVRRCPCGKPNGYTLKTCNACGSALPEEVTFTDNVFMGFIYGIRGFNVSMRFQSETHLCFDDLLQLSTCHLNCIPTTAYIPDWRTLLKRPAEGRRILQSLYDTCLNVFEEQFYSKPQWRASWLKGRPTFEEMKPHIVAGLNFPPSQYQLHLQFIVNPLMPFQYQMYLKNNHHTFGRFFPLEYVLQVLDTGYAIPDADTMAIEDIITEFNGRGVRYNDIHAACYARYGRSHVALANYSPEHFEALVVDGERVLSLTTGEDVPIPVKEVVAQDKVTLQSYGFKAPGDKTLNLTYLEHVKAPPVPNW